MNKLELLFLTLYIVFIALAWPVMGCWLHNTGKFNGSRLCAVAVGLALAFAWPFSLIAAHFLEKSRAKEKTQDEPTV